MSSLSDNYDLDTVKLLGQGSDATVQRAVERKSGEWHAIKLIRAGTDDPNGAREQAMMRRVQHPHVMKLLAYYAPTEARPTAALVMQEADFSLYEYIYRSIGRTRPPESVGVDIAAQLSQGLAFIHHNHIVHRDLHAANVMMMVEPSRPGRIAGCGAVSHSGMRVLIADFSRACELKTSCPALRTSPGYCAPERLVGPGAMVYGTAFDVWSLGALIFELATTEPFVILPESVDVSSKWALKCCQIRTRRRLSHESPIPGVQPWQDSFTSSATRQCPPCSAVFSSALEATLRWYPSEVKELQRVKVIKEFQRVKERQSNRRASKSQRASQSQRAYKSTESSTHSLSVRLLAQSLQDLLPSACPHFQASAAMPKKVPARMAKRTTTVRNAQGLKLYDFIEFYEQKAMKKAMKTMKKVSARLIKRCVFAGKTSKTHGGLSKGDLRKNPKTGKIVSKKVSAKAKKSPWIVRKALPVKKASPAEALYKK